MLDVPHNPEIERTLISGLIQWPEAYPDIAAILPEDTCFLDTACRLVWVAMGERRRAEQTWDLKIISAHLHNAGLLEDVGGWGGYAELAGAFAVQGNLEHYALQVHGLWLRRQMIHLGTDMSRDASELSGGEPGEIRQTFEQKLFALGETGLAGKPITSTELSVQVLSRIERYANGEKAGLPFGYIDVDNIFCGMAPKAVTLLAGRPGGGKSKLAANVAVNIAEQGIGVGFFSLEMSNEELGLRVACAISGVDHYLLTKNKLNDEQSRQLSDACHHLSRLPIHWQDKPGLKPAELMAWMMRLKRKEKIGLAIVDHILLMRPDHRVNNRSRNDEVGDISRAVKLIAKETGIPILALCQMNRGVEHRNTAPRLSDLRDSGNLEQDADNVMFLHRQQTEKDEPMSSEVELYIAKQRNGPTGKVTLFDRKGCFRFENFAGQV